MAVEVLMPKLGATMEKGTIMMWLKNEGDPILAGEPLIEIMTDKVNMELEAEVSGVLLKKLYEDDTEVPVNQVIGYIGQKGEQIDVSLQSASGQATGQTAEEADQAADSVISLGASRIRATPSAKRLSREHGVELEQLAGTGPNGRVQQVDVESFLEESSRGLKATPLAERIAADQNVNLQQLKGSGIQDKIMSRDVKAYMNVKQEQANNPVQQVNTIPMEGIRKVIARRMVESAFTAPHVTLVSEVDMLESRIMREQLLPSIEKQTGFRLSYTEIIVKAVAIALLQHPMMNASLQGEVIVMNQGCHIGLAVAVSDGLLVPVIRDANTMGLAALTAESKKLGQLARDNKLKLDQMSGGTFTISNLGMYAVDAFTPIINQPESAILGVGRIVEKPVGVNGTIVLRPMMTLSLSFDHRIIDGATAAAFLTELNLILEKPLKMLI